MDPNEPAMTVADSGALSEVVVRELIARQLTIGMAESLTGGLVCAALTDVPGASATVRGAVVSYAVEVKARVLGVDPDLLAQRGAVDPDVAVAMAQGAARVLGADLAVATTGVAGPSPSDGAPVGTVYVAVAWAMGASTVREFHFTGSRAQIRVATVAGALALVRQVLASD